MFSVQVDHVSDLVLNIIEALFGLKSQISCKEELSEALDSSFLIIVLENISGESESMFGFQTGTMADIALVLEPASGHKQFSLESNEYAFCGLIVLCDCGSKGFHDGFEHTIEFDIVDPDQKASTLLTTDHGFTFSDCALLLDNIVLHQMPLIQLHFSFHFF